MKAILFYCQFTACFHAANEM